MSERPPKGTRSGEHKAVQFYRARLESYDEHQLAELRALSERVNRLRASVPPPRPDPRRDGDEEPAVDVVVIPPSQPAPVVLEDGDDSPPTTRKV